ncbi:PD-(D/E)XK nuclease family protein [Candidatus Woesearchaeota archaeon]|nr:PD-(D/E)XK nuclease family protein [Candidatus Woesearchaeota archaeon]
MPTYSHSRISTFETCPLQYKYSYIDRVETEQESIEAFLGSRVHETLELLYKDLKFEKLNTLPQILEFFNKTWNENWNNNIKITRKEYGKENYRKMGEAQITDYYNKYHPFNQGKVIGIETQDILELNNHYSFHIRIDRLVDRGNGIYEIHDYKTSNQLPKQSYLDNDRQLAIYSLWVRNNFKDFKKARLIWHFLLFNKEMESSRTIKQLTSLKEDILKKIKIIESAKVFKPKKSNICGWCRFQNICPVWGHELELKEKTVNEYLNDPGVKLVNEYVNIKNELKEFSESAEIKLEKLKEALINFCKKKDLEVVVGSDNEISVKETESLKFPGKNTEEREKLLKVLKKMKKLDEVTDLDICALKRIVEEQEWDKKNLKKLEPFETREVSFRLSVRKKREE